MLIIKLNSKLLNNVQLTRHPLNSCLVNKYLIDVQQKRTSSISITLKEDELPLIRTKYEKLYENKYFKNKDKDEFKSKLIDYFNDCRY